MSARRAGARSSLLLMATVVAAVTSTASGQSPSTPPDRVDPGDLPPPLTLTYAESGVELVRDAGPEAATPPDILEDGDRLITNNGRAELVLADGAMAYVDHDSEARVDRGVRLRLVTGRLLVRTTSDAEPVVVATPAGWALLEAEGEYDLTADDLRGDTSLTVLSGRATWRPGSQEVSVGPDDILLVHPRDGRARWARGRPLDEFIDWTRRRAATMTASTAPMTLPPPVRPWGADLAMYGQWAQVAPYGVVWFPRATGWRPYANGAWRFTHYGWTWIDRDRWAWPLHHYGRWGYHDVRGWYWIPHRDWGPAWVGWALGADHVAWAPLGWDARPLVDFSYGVRVGPVGLWLSSWSIAPRHAFGVRGTPWTPLQDPRRLSGPVLGGFVSQLVGPRGPADYDDRFAVRAGRSAPPALPRGWALPRPPDQQDRANRRRPEDAPPPGASPTGSGAPAGRPRDREWSTPPGGRIDDRGGAGRPVMPVGPPVRPRVEPTPPATDGDAAPRERALPRRDPAAGGHTPSGDPGRSPRRPEAGRGGGTGGTGGVRERSEPGGPGTGSGDPARPADRGAAAGGSRRRAG